jgi:1,2-dihydroxy-3-keto-5-methylthiopentene dioxygenase
MSSLTIFLEDSPEGGELIREHHEMAARLARVGVTLQRWEADQPLPATASDEQVVTVYRESVDRLMRDFGLQSVDVVGMRPDHPKKEELRQKFLDEHTHADFEVRFFVEGRGMFYIHTAERVYAMLCEKGDLISVPADTPHWFDMGRQPSFRCIRLFTTPEGWVARFTGSSIARRFPTFDALVARTA